MIIVITWSKLSAKNSTESSIRILCKERGKESWRDFHPRQVYLCMRRASVFFQNDKISFPHSQPANPRNLHYNGENYIRGKP